MITLNNKKYKILDLLFDNKHSRIYKCVCDNEHYILKCYREKSIKRWNNVVNVLSDINGHPNIIKMFSYHSHIEIQNNKYHVIIMEYAEYGDLYEYFTNNNGFITKEIVLNIFSQVLCAINHMYKYNWSHRDIKLENILITGYEPVQIKIIDFEFATQKIHSNNSVGTLGYMSPQILQREEYNTFKNDIWNLGVLLFSLYTGNRPYSEPLARKKNRNDNSWKCEWLSAIENKKWDLFWYSTDYKHEKKIDLSLLNNKYEYPVEFKKLIEKMLCWNEKDRISLIALFNEPLLKDKLKEINKNKNKNKIFTSCRCIIV